ncbi:MAG: PQQ-binding-like beta-propeller repeat protein, partial [Nitrospira sp. CR2.1]|nr:PQQ-binding-like beta-propeller repeat protein [Nitrospira sp. CR2.1]
MRLALFAIPLALAAQNVDWPVYLGDKATSHYSALTQITKQNVTQLRQVWRHETGDTGEFQSNPLIIDGILYTASPLRKILALKAATGERLWTFDPLSERADNPGRRQRGVVYWADGNDRRIFTGAGAYLYAIDAATGKPIRTFGNNGSIHLGEAIETHGNPGPPT